MVSVAPSIPSPNYSPSFAITVARFIAWSIVATLLVFLLNVYLTFWRGWPGSAAILQPDSVLLSWLQAGFYLLAVVLAALYVLKTPERNPHQDYDVITALAAFIARFAFWTVLLVGLADAAISFLRVEEMLDRVVDVTTAQDLARNQFRGPYVHMPLIVVSLILAAVTRTIGFHWLALLVVVAELQIVLSRFVFSYEQAFMGDLVRFWYAGLFLFSSAYTLVEDGHVRVDILYQGGTPQAKGLVNALGSLLLGLPLCWVVLIIGLGGATSIISSPLLALEVSQAGFGMYIKYLMAAMLGIFAITMTIQFAGYFLEGIADYCSIPGKRHNTDPHSTTSA
jgi:TRAP-type mannitol/chloroaromatic compound transport system permease small subunit